MITSLNLCFLLVLGQRCLPSFLASSSILLRVCEIFVWPFSLLCSVKFWDLYFVVLSEPVPISFPISIKLCITSCGQFPRLLIKSYLTVLFFCLFVFYFIFIYYYFKIFTQGHAMRERERDKGRTDETLMWEKHWLVASHMRNIIGLPPVHILSGDQTHNAAMALTRNQILNLLL